MRFSGRLARPHARIDRMLRALPRSGWNASGTFLVLRQEGQGGFGVVLMVNRGASLGTTEWASTSYAALLKLLLQEVGELYQERVDHAATPSHCSCSRTSPDSTPLPCGSATTASLYTA